MVRSGKINFAEDEVAYTLAGAKCGAAAHTLAVEELAVTVLAGHGTHLAIFLKPELAAVPCIEADDVFLCIV